VNEMTAVQARPTFDILGQFAATGPGTLAGTYWRQFWHPVARAEDLPAGRATKIRVMGEDFTLFRGETGIAHVTAHRCPHRGTQLSAGYVEGDAIRCIYHGWKFGGDGACLERPGEGPGGEPKSSIAALPTREFIGLIFAYFGPCPAPPFPPYAGFAGEGIVETKAVMFPCNYFQSYENNWDLYHAKYVHKTGALHVSDFDGMQATEVFEELDSSVRRTLDIKPGVTMVSYLLPPGAVRLYVPTSNELRRRGMGPQFRQTFIIHVPIDDVSHMSFLSQLVPVTGVEAEQYRADYEEVLAVRAAAIEPLVAARQILNSTARIEDFRGHPMLVEIEDMAAQLGQGDIAAIGASRLGRTDAGVSFLRRLYARELQALAAGLPTKQWAYLEQPATLSA
jgi:5,5'-dehydrodivanillate O-demethylase